MLINEGRWRNGEGEVHCITTFEKRKFPLAEAIFFNKLQIDNRHLNNYVYCVQMKIKLAYY